MIFSLLSQKKNNMPNFFQKIRFHVLAACIFICYSPLQLVIVEFPDNDVRFVHSTVRSSPRPHIAVLVAQRSSFCLQQSGVFHLMPFWFMLGDHPSLDHDSGTADCMSSINLSLTQVQSRGCMVLFEQGHVQLLTVRQCICTDGEQGKPLRQWSTWIVKSNVHRHGIAWIQPLFLSLWLGPMPKATLRSESSLEYFSMLVDSSRILGGSLLCISITCKDICIYEHTLEGSYTYHVDVWLRWFESYGTQTHCWEFSARDPESRAHQG